MKDYFPSKLASGDRFCNRIEEKRLLKDNVKLGRPSVMVSPRRYGKSSLVHQVVAELKIPFAAIDFFLAHDDRAIVKRMLVGISQAISQIMPPSQKTLTAVQKFFANFKISLNAAGFGIQASFSSGDIDAVDQVYDALKSLSKLANQQKRIVLIFIDEFQDITVAESSKSIQGAIRNIAQSSSDLVFVFSGSSQHLLLELFDNKSMPLYMLCDKIHLDRISSKDYIPYLQTAAQERWQKKLDEVSLKRILTLTELHPFYVNMLCNQLWRRDICPESEDIIVDWNLCYESEKRRLISDLEKLTHNQQDILKYLALHSIIEPTGKKFLNLTGISSSSMKSGITTLIDKDMIYIVKQTDEWLNTIKKGQYRVLDPLLAYALKKYA